MRTPKPSRAERQLIASLAADDVTMPDRLNLVVSYADPLAVQEVLSASRLVLEGLDGGAVIIESSVWFGSPSR